MMLIKPILLKESPFSNLPLQMVKQLAFALSIAGFLAVPTGSVAQTESNSLNDNSSETASEAIPVHAKALEDLVVYPKTRVSASVISLRHADISVQAAGAIDKLFAEVGDQLTKGDALLKLDCRDADIQIEVAQSAKKLAEKEWRRAEKLQRSNTIPEQQFNQSKAAFEQASSQLKQARLQVTRCQLTSPYDGIVTARYAQLGAYLQPGAPVYRLIDPSRTEGITKLAENQILALQQANQLTFESEAKQYPVTFRMGQAFVDPASLLREVRFSFPEVDEPSPMPGTSGWLIWQNEAPHLPANFLVEREQQLGYFELREGRAVFMPLLDASLGYPVALFEVDLQTKVITDGRHRLVDGDTVDLL